MVNAKGALEQDFCALLQGSVYIQAVWESIPGRPFRVLVANPNERSDDLNRSENRINP